MGQGPDIMQIGQGSGTMIGPSRVTGSNPEMTRNKGEGSFLLELPGIATGDGRMLDAPLAHINFFNAKLSSYEKTHITAYHNSSHLLSSYYVLGLVPYLLNNLKWLLEFLLFSR